MKNTVALETLGCKLNQAETESLARLLAEAGYRLLPPSDGADIYILNTCTVTHVADRKSRHLLRSARRRNPHALVIATGCYAQRAPQELAQIEGVVVLGNDEKSHLASILGHRVGASREPTTISHPILRTRSLVKVQEGCNQPCSYCIVPLVRGRERSLSIDEVLAEVNARVAMGYQELILTGTRIGGYRPSLELLVQRILDNSGVARLRLSSLQPQELTPGLVALWADRRLCRHFHLPLQSGSDPVLGRMGRRYSVGDYGRAVAMVREQVPDVAITTDVMVGFPGESDEEFEQSYRFCRGMEFSGIHVFPYSERPGTPAARMPGKVDQGAKRDRVERMLNLSREAAYRFQGQFLGQTMLVLWEGESDDGVWMGHTDNYIRVFTQTSKPVSNMLLQTRLAGRSQRGLWGELGNSVERDTISSLVTIERK